MPCRPYGVIGQIIKLGYPLGIIMILLIDPKFEALKPLNKNILFNRLSEIFLSLIKLDADDLSEISFNNFYFKENNTVI